MGFYPQRLSYQRQRKSPSTHIKNRPLWHKTTSFHTSFWLQYKMHRNALTYNQVQRPSHILNKDYNSVTKINQTEKKFREKCTFIFGEDEDTRVKRSFFFFLFCPNKTGGKKAGGVWLWRNIMIWLISLSRFHHATVCRLSLSYTGISNPDFYFVQNIYRNISFEKKLWNHLILKIKNVRTIKKNLFQNKMIRWIYYTKSSEQIQPAKPLQLPLFIQFKSNQKYILQFQTKIEQNW